MYELQSNFTPQGDQPQSIAKIVNVLSSGSKQHVLLGATGTGKTFTMAHVIAQLGCSALIIAPNKTLAAQLYTEFKTLFPKNSVGFFISYYDYYQPEAYVPSTDTYIAKDSAINDDIDKMRHEATRSLFEDKQVIVIASVSCIYGLGSPESYGKMILPIQVGASMSRDHLLRQLIDIQYTRNDRDLERGSFRVRGDTVDILPSHKSDEAIRVELWGDTVEALELIDPLSGETRRKITEMTLYPNSHYVADRTDIKVIIKEILEDLSQRLQFLKAQGRLLEYQRLEQRTMQDVELLEQLGFCPGIENYSRYFSGKKTGEPPPCLLDYFPKDFLTIIDESHITIPQIGGMYRGDRSRKQTLVDFGFRMPSALDNRPLNFSEFMERTDRILYVSATPGTYELEHRDSPITEQVIRPTGLLDPEITVKPTENQVDDLLGELKRTVQAGGRILITTLTKKMAEDLTTHYRDLGIKVKYLHSDIDTLERMTLLRELRRGDFDVLVGINLLREGLDLPEVMLVAVMDADKEGFLRSRTSLIQIVGRAARNHKARVIFYGAKITNAMREAMDETNRRRDIQQAYNKANGITPMTVIKDIPADLRVIYGIWGSDDDEPHSNGGNMSIDDKLATWGVGSLFELEKLLIKKKKEMKQAAGNLDFETAAKLRDEVREMSSLLLQQEAS